MLILAVPVLAWLNKDNIYDAARLHNYQVPAQVVQLADDNKMTPSSRRLFYVYHPQLQDKASFNTSCSGGEKTIVLGCYVLRKGIYLYDVKDERLQGVVQVTAAHEMLHAAYDRLSSGDRKKVSGWLNEAYGQVTNKRIQDTIENYRKDGADITNELHSILGTEVRNLPSPLEDYYKRYFSDRSTVVSYSEKYEAAFSERQAQAEQYLAQLNSLKAEINDLNGQLVAERESLDAQYNQLQNDRSNTNDVNNFNARVRAFNAQVAGYNARVARVSSLIDQHNAILEKYNALVVEEQQLYKAIDSRPGTIQSQ
jgi:hypothetical protein